MKSKPLTVLFIEPQEQLTPLLRDAFAASAEPRDRVLQVAGVQDVVERVAREPVDILLFDIEAADDAAELVRSVRAGAPELPIVAISIMDGDAKGAAALDAGADDRFSREHLQSPLLGRSLRYAVDRRRMQQMLRELSLTDELTGLYNLHGFLTFAEHHLKLAVRTRGLVAGCFALEPLRTRRGRDDDRRAAERAMRDAADLLRATFRASDVLARVGDGEFVALAVDAPADAVSIIEQRLGRLAQSLASSGSQAGAICGDIAPVSPMGDAGALLAQIERMKRQRRALTAVTA